MKRMLETVFLAVFPPVATVAVGVLVRIVLAPLLSAMAVDLITIWVSMLLGMVVLPACYLQREHGPLQHDDLGVRWPGLPQLLIGLCLLTGLAVHMSLRDPAVLWAFLQNIPIAFSEEFWSKGILIRQLVSYVKSPVVLIVVSACVFAFVTHFNQPFLANLLYRFPFGLLTAMLFLWTKSLYWPICLHLGYNVMVS